MARGNSAALNEWRRHAAPYLEGKKPFSAEWKAAQKEASRDWAGSRRSNPDTIDNFEEGAGIGAGLVIGGIAAIAGLCWLGHAVSKMTGRVAYDGPPHYNTPHQRSGL